MNTDIRIDWHAGMEITPQTFIDLENDLAEHRMLLRKILAAQVFGIIPQSKFDIDYDVAGFNLTIRKFECTVMLPSGQVITDCSEEERTVSFPDQGDATFYLTVETGERVVAFERGGIEHVANEYCFSFKPLAAIRDAMPLLKFHRDNGACMACKDFVPPVVSVRSSIALMEQLDSIRQNIQKILDHSSFSMIENQMIPLLAADKVLRFQASDSPRQLAECCYQLAMTLSYPIFERKPELPEFNAFDASIFFSSFNAFLASTLTAMDDLQPKQPEPEPEPVEEIFCPSI